MRRSMLLLGVLVLSIVFTSMAVYEEKGSLRFGESGKNVQKLVIDGDSMAVEVLINGTYHPGDVIRADFYITNKQGSISRIDLKLDVYYLGFKVFSYQHPSWREYNEGETVHIFYESRLPRITPPGRYVLRFYVTPENRKTMGTVTSITVLPNLAWILLLIALLSFLTAGLVFIRWHWGRLSAGFTGLSPGQRFILLAIGGLMGVPCALMIGAEKYADTISLLTYYLLLVGILNLGWEYLKPSWGEQEDMQIVVSTYLLSILIYLSGDVILRYVGIFILVLGTIMLLRQVLLARGREFK